jgi:hypothetical protein
MAVIDTITIGSDVFSVYALTAPNAVAETTTFFNGRLGAEATAWAAAVLAAADDEKRALAAAADWMDRALLFSGEESSPPQPRAWPRDNATNGCTGDALGAGAIPDEMFYAQAWLAGVILANNAADASSGEGSNVKSVKAGSAAVSFFSPTTGTVDDTRLPTIANDYTKCFTDAGTSSGIAGPTATGTGQASSFCADDDTFIEGLS